MSGRLLMNVRLARSPTADVELGRPSKCRECSRASTTLSGIAAMPGIRSLSNHGKSCRSPGTGIGTSVNQSEGLVLVASARL
jgi:hypothetical protein